MAFVEITQEGQDARRVELDVAETSIGRAEDNAVMLEGPAVSGHHCVIVKDGQKYSIRDLDSTNGTRLNGHAARENRLRPGDVIRIGAIDIRIDGKDIDVEGVPVLSSSDTQVVDEPVFDVAREGVAPASDSPFGARRRSKAIWFVLIGIIIGALLLGLGYWFVTMLMES